MSRLKAPPSRLLAIRPKLQAPKDEAGRTRYRKQASPWRAWYNTARWQKLRWQVLVDAMFTCAMCGKMEAQSRNLVADHITPHRGDEALFWDRQGIQCLCKSCHDSAKQREERRREASLGHEESGSRADL